MWLYSVALIEICSTNRKYCLKFPDAHFNKELQCKKQYLKTFVRRYQLHPFLCLFKILPLGQAKSLYPSVLALPATDFYLVRNKIFFLADCLSNYWGTIA